MLELIFYYVNLGVWRILFFNRGMFYFLFGWIRRVFEVEFFLENSLKYFIIFK